MSLIAWPANQTPGTIPPVQLVQNTFRDVFLLVGRGADGVIMDGSDTIQRRSAIFSNLNPHRGQASSELPPEKPGFKTLFSCFDAAWWNWYHWNVLALPRLALAARRLPPAVPLAVPAEIMRLPAWRDALHALDLGERILALEPGRYPVGQLHILQTTTPTPTDIVYLDAFHSAVPVPDLPQTRLIAIRRAGNARLDAAEQGALGSVATKFGMEHVDLAEHSFEAQRAMFAGAALVVAAHGSALANLMHCRPGTRVLELKPSARW